MPQRLVRVLRDCGVELSAHELVDALWLASRLPEGAAAPLAHALGPVAAPTGGEAARQGAATGGDTGQGATDPERADSPGSGGTARTSRVEGGSASALHAAAGDHRPGPRGATSRSALALRVPEEKALTAELGLGRALRALKQHRAGARQDEIDEDATASAMAETGLPDVVLRPGRERWLDLALVVDDGVSMLLWRRLCAELRALLERLGAFRNVRVYGLCSRGPGRPRLSARPFGGEEAMLDAATAADPSGHTLVLVVSDGVGAMWRDGRMHSALERWAGCGPTAVVHALPLRMWPGSGIRAEDWQVTVRQAGSANDTWQVADPVLPPELAMFEGVPVPVLEPEPSAVASWARLVASEGDSAMLPLLAPPASAGRISAQAPGVSAPPVPVPCAPSADASAPRLPEAGASGAGPCGAGGSGAADPVLRFRDVASPEAYRLASHLAAVAPVSVPVMRLVQLSVPWRAQTAHLAEVFLGGLMRRSDHDGHELPPQHRSFDFDESARAVLLDAVPAAELLSTGRAIADRLTRLVGRSPDFPAWLAHPDGTRELDPAARPFAWVGAPLLAHLGITPEKPEPTSAEEADDADSPLMSPRVLRGAATSWQPLRGSDPPSVGRYGLVARNDAGANALSFSAVTPGSARVLVKLARARGYSAAWAMLSTEQRALRRMAGRHAPRLMDADSHGAPPWLATRLVRTRAGSPAPTLRALDRVPDWRWPKHSFTRFGHQLAEAVSVCHRERMVHRALSPDTVLVTEDQVTVVGWMAALIDGEDRDGGQAVLGGGPYRAPEVADPGTHTEASDVYSLGATLLMASRNRLAQPLDADLESLLRRCVDPDPALRPTARAVADAFALRLPPERGKAAPARPEASTRRPARHITVIDFSSRQERGSTTALLGILLAERGDGEVLVINGASAVTALDNRMRYSADGPRRAHRLDFAGARAFVSRHRSGLDVLTYSPRASAQLAADGYRQVCEAAAEQYGTVLVEPGGGEYAALMRRGAVETTTQVLLVADQSAHGLQQVERATLRLAAEGGDGLGRNAVVAIKQGHDRPVSVWGAEARLRQRCRSVHFLPHDRRLADGGELDSARLAKDTLLEYRLLANVTAGPVGGAI
ncbi:SAV_2336 N-terminal domain-related protein [Wenjunlia tyrosinilytica]|uniref:Protein kinase domain-containing protein n=1 Tax=Wenjunlia tyrosinilytica TaxID=1544741 RepID=A0A917ZSA8_9ACTN|nr:SAV_2336 N-terminal domain-related protein [Wenjunlia tyrosinilytica]GGO91244.1 hypothetical protein GCM10012280_38640 [Wenjunlia tyrosinilytica]